MLANAGLKCYHPEMHEKKPIAQIEASLGHYGNHYYLRTPLALKERGTRRLLKNFSNSLDTHNAMRYNINNARRNERRM